MTLFKPPALDKTVPIVSADGRITPYFQRFWQNLSFTAAAGAEGAFDFGPQIADINAEISTLQTGKANKLTGFTAATGTASRTAFATYTAPAISASPTQAEVQAIADHLQVISRHVKAMIDDLKA